MKFRLKELREDKDLTQVDIGNILNISRQHYSQYEREEVELRAGQITALCKFYGVSADYLLGFDKALPFPSRDVD